LENIINNLNEMTAHNLFYRGNAPENIPNMPNAPGKPMPMACDPGLGICSVPIQEWEQLYDEDTAFSAGTVFPCLDKPFLGGGK